MYRFQRAFVVVVAICWATTAQAATVNIANGTVSVNGGQPVSGTATVKTGDLVTVGPNSAATVAYDNGCSVAAQASTTVTVVTDEQCAATMGQTAPSSINGATLAIGAAALAGAVGIAIAASQSGGSSNSKSSSP